MNERLIAFYPTLVPLTGSHSAAVVLSQILYWHQGRLRVKRRGLYWLAKSRAEMCEETGITLDQYKRIMPLLVRQGWVILERGLFKNKITPFIRLTDQGRQLVSKAPNRLVPKATNRLVSSAPNLSTENTAENVDISDIARKDHSPERTGETYRRGRAYGVIGEQEKKENREKKENDQKSLEENLHEKSGAAMNAADILKQAAEQTKVGSLEAFWKARCELVLNKYQRALTAKERGQLKYLQQYLGDQTRPVIDYALNHWWKFATIAGASAGTSFPAAPHIGFLLKHYGVAMNLLHPPPAPLPVLVSTVDWQLVQSIAEAQKQAEAAEVHKLTPQELTELLEGLKAP